MQSTVVNYAVDTLQTNEYRIKADTKPLARRIAGAGYQDNPNNLPVVVMGTQTEAGVVKFDKPLVLAGSRRIKAMQDILEQGIDLFTDEKRSKEMEEILLDNIMAIQGNPLVSVRVYEALTEEQQQVMLADDLGKLNHGQAELVKTVCYQLKYTKKSLVDLQAEFSVNGSFLRACKGINCFKPISKAYFAGQEDKRAPLFHLTDARKAYDQKKKNNALKIDDIVTDIIEARDGPKEPNALGREALKGVLEQYRSPLLKAMIAVALNDVTGEQLALLQDEEKKHE